MKARIAVPGLKLRNRKRTRVPQGLEASMAPTVQATNATVLLQGIQVKIYNSEWITHPKVTHTFTYFFSFF